MGDGETMAVESAILGTPSIETEIVKLSGNRVADTTSIHGPVDELVNKYDLMFAFSDPKKSLDKAIEILKDDSSKKEWIKKSERLINDKVDVTEFAIKLVENHREHIENIRGI